MLGAAKMVVFVLAAICLAASWQTLSADPIFGARVSHMTVPNGADDPKLSVEYWPYEEGIQMPSLKPGQEAMEMVDGSTGSRYHCIIPNITALGVLDEEEEGAEGTLPLFGDLSMPQQNQQQQQQQQPQQQQQRRKGVPEGATRKSPEEILNQMQGLPCTYKMEGWWTYEFCYKDKIRQLHFEQVAENKLVITMEFVLGYYDAAASVAAQKTYENQFAQLTPEERSEKKRFFVQVYSGGTACDLTGEQRKTEAKFFCEEGVGGQQQQQQQQQQQLSVNYIKSIMEGSTCRYEMQFISSMLCVHRDFRTVKQPKNVINCYELAREEEEASSPSLQPPSASGGKSMKPTAVPEEVVPSGKEKEKGKEGKEVEKKRGKGEEESGKGVEESEEIEMVLGEDEELKALEEELDAL